MLNTINAVGMTKPTISRGRHRRRVTLLAAVLSLLGLLLLAFAGFVPPHAIKSVGDALSPDGDMDRLTPSVIRMVLLLIRCGGVLLLLLGGSLLLFRPKSEALMERAAETLIQVRPWLTHELHCIRQSPLLIPAIVTLLGFWILYSALGMHFQPLGVFDHYDAFFQSDPPRVIRDIAHPHPNGYRTTVHPLFVLLFNPIGLLFAKFMTYRATAAIALNALVAASAVMFAQVVFRLLGMTVRSSILWSLLTGLSAAHMVFGAIPETHIFAASALALTVILVLRYPGRALFFVPAGVLTFGITITNLLPSAALYGFSKPWKGFRQWIGKLTLYGGAVLFCGAGLSFLQFLAYPETKPFFLPQSYATGGIVNYFAVFRSPHDVLQRVAQQTSNMFLYSMVAPKPFVITEGTPAHVPTAHEARVMCPAACKNLELADAVIRQPNSHPPTVTFQNGPLPEFTWFGYFTVVLWLALLGLGAYQLVVHGPVRSGLLLSLAMCLAFFYVFHLLYGDDLFLFTAHWTFLLILGAALAVERYWRSRWLELLVAAIVVCVAIENLLFLQTAWTIFS